MRLTRQRGRATLVDASTPVSPWVFGAIPALLLLVFLLDRATEAAPIQHLYYVPIALAAVWLGARVALAVSSGAVVLYHLANPALLEGPYKDTDLVQIAIFFVVGLVTARMARDTRRLHRLATTDDLTGLHNLRSFETRLTAAIVRAGRTGEPLSLLVLDLDRLKQINDVHGHLAGGEAVQCVGRVLAERLPRTAIACRYGGDEFVVALPAVGTDEASLLADDIRRAVQALDPELARKTFPRGSLSVSVGVAGLYVDRRVQPTEAAAIGESLFQAADAALYDAKRDGRNRVARQDTFNAA